MDKVRLAIVGCGNISRVSAPGFLRHERCEVSVLCDSAQERAELRAREWGISPRIYTRYEQVLDDPDVDAVALLTPTPLHARQSVAALEAGKHVSCEKPLAASVAEADQIAAAVDRASTRFRLTEHVLYYPPIVKAKELLDSGAIGEPSLVRIRTARGIPAGGAATERPLPTKVPPDAMAWRKDPAANPGGFLYDAGWHDYFTAMWLVGDVESVYAMVTKTDHFWVEMPSAVVWKFRDRDCLAVFEYSFAHEMPVASRNDSSLEIQGSKGSIWVTFRAGQMLGLPPVMLLRGADVEGFEIATDESQGFDGAARDFVDSLLNDTQPDLDVHFSKRLLQATLALYEASEAKREVDPATVT